MQNKKGFTLVELMVVVAIAGILVAVAVPIYGTATKQTKERVCRTNRLMLKSVVTTYLEVGNNNYPYSFTTAARSFGMENPPKENAGAVAGPFAEDSWPEAIKEGFEDEKLPRCPFDEENGQYLITLHCRPNDVPTVEVTCEIEHGNK